MHKLQGVFICNLEQKYVIHHHARTREESSHGCQNTELAVLCTSSVHGVSDAMSILSFCFGIYSVVDRVIYSRF